MLTKAQKVANSVFFERVFLLLNDGGKWEGDDGMMVKSGEYFLTNDETYNYIKSCTTDEWFKKRVVLFINESSLPCEVIEKLMKVVGRIANDMKKAKDIKKTK